MVYIQVIMMCLLFGIMTGCYQLILWKDFRTARAKDRVAIVTFYSFMFYGVLSFVKIILGEKNSTLFESFKDINARTYGHYGPMLLAIALVLPVTINTVLKKDRIRILYAYDSWIFMLCAVCFTVTGTVSNLMYASILAAGLILTMIFVRKMNTEDDIRLKIKYIFPSVLFWIITVIIYIPGEIYLNNLWEFHIAPLTYARIILLAFLCIIVYMAGTICFLTNKQTKILSRIIFALTIMGYLQNMFLNGHMSAMDGTRQTWSVGKSVINAVIWIGIVLCIVAADKLIHKSVDKLYQTICIYASIVELVSLVVMVCMAEDLPESQKLYGSEYAQLTRQGIYELASDDNVIVFVLDWYDEQIMEQILADDKDFLKPLDGFTYYSNTASLYAYTKMSIPYLLTGIEWTYNMSEYDYCQQAFSNSSMIQDMKDAGYDVSIYTDSDYLTGEAVEGAFNSGMFYDKVNICKQLYIMSNIARYQMAPFILKWYFWYEPQNLQDMIMIDKDIYLADSVSDDMRFYDELTASGLQINDSRQKLFKFIHLYGAHPPCGIDESSANPYNAAMLKQAKESMNIVFEYLEQMKKLGVYDTSTIIITADHGENYLYDPEEKNELLKLCLESTSNPILLVKSSIGEKRYEEGINYSNAPVSHKEVIGEIMKTVNPSLKGYGNSLCEIDENADTKREFIFKRGDRIYVKVLIDGDIRDINHWNVIED